MINNIHFLQNMTLLNCTSPFIHSPIQIFIKHLPYAWSFTKYLQSYKDKLNEDPAFWEFIIQS